MSRELNDAFRQNPKRFFKHHLILKNRLETERPIRNLPAEVLIDFEYIRKEITDPVVVKRLTPRLKMLKNMHAVEIKFCKRTRNAYSGNFRPTQQNGGIRIYYVPFSESTGHYRTLGQGADFVFTHTLSGCEIYTSMPGASPFRMLHMSGEASDQTRQRKITECFGDAPYQKISLPQYSEFNGKEAQNTNLIGIRQIGDHWDFYAQGYDTGLFITPEYKAKRNATGITHLCFFTWSKIKNWIISNEDQ